MAKKPLSVGVKAALITAFAVILVAVIQLMRNTTPTNSQTISNSPGAIQAGRDVNVTPIVVVPVALQKVPIEPLEFRQKREGVFIVMGNDTIGLPPVPPGQQGIKDIGRAFLMAGTHEHPSQIQLIADENQIILNIKFAPIFGMPPLEITNNELNGLPSNWDCNHSAKGIEIVNEKRTPIFQMYYKDDTHLVVNGAITFIREGVSGYVLASETTGIQISSGANITSDEFFKKIETLPLKPIFKYPAWQHPKDYADE